MRPEKLIRRELAAAERKVARASEARRRLPPGSSRARVTTANANWASACEHRDRLLSELDKANDEAAAAVDNLVQRGDEGPPAR